MGASDPRRWVPRWDPDLEPDENDMEFRLTYAGRLLPARNDDRLRRGTLHIHEIRKVFQKQLRRLWQTHPAFRGYNMNDKDKWMFQHFMHDGFDWLPLTTKQNGMICKLDILMLREGQPGKVLYDIDNRLKTVFDALRKADGPDELGRNTPQGQMTPDNDEHPFFVLLENDNLITHVSVTTDTLLQPIDGVPPDESVRMVMNVTVRPYRPSVVGNDFL